MKETNKLNGIQIKKLDSHDCGYYSSRYMYYSSRYTYHLYIRNYAYWEYLIPYIEQGICVYNKNHRVIIDTTQTRIRLRYRHIQKIFTKLEKLWKRNLD